MTAEIVLKENVLEVSNKMCVKSTKNTFIYTRRESESEREGGRDFQDKTSKICPRPIPCWENTLSYID